MSQDHLKYALDPVVEALLNGIRVAGGRPLLVGGCVRDALMGITPKDIDIEVFGLGVKELKRALSRQGRVFVVGTSFGVIKVTLANGVELDVSLPCRTSVRGVRGVMAEVDPNTTPREAASRRDFTINAMAYDFSTHELLDFYDGQADLARGILRRVGPAFADDPLRVLRAVQFAGRWNFRIDPETAEFCAGLRSEYGALARERVWLEWEKLLKKSSKPSAGLRVLEETRWRSLYPELDSLADHPNETGWTRTLRRVDAITEICERDGVTGEPRATLTLAALCYDMDKRVWDLPEGTLSEVERFLSSIGCVHQVIKQVVPLTREYLNDLDNEPTARWVRHLAQRLQPATMEQWERLAEAHRISRQPDLVAERPGLKWLQLAQSMNCATHPVEPLLMGRHLKEFGLAPGPQFRSLLNAAMEAQLDGVISTLAEARSWLAEKLKADLPIMKGGGLE